MPNPPTPAACSTHACTSTAHELCPHQQSALLDWDNPSTWPDGVVPAVDADVTLPSESKVLISQTISELRVGLVTIPAGSELILGGSASAISLHATGFLVYGALRAGSETCRLLTPIEITLHGTRPATRAARDALPAWSKGIHVAGGTLELHGKLYHQTWARLAQKVNSGDSAAVLQASVNWAAGQQVLLVTSALKDARDWHRNEILTIDEVQQISDGASTPPNAAPGAVVRFTSPAQFTHEANEDYQVEVALLSRMIKIQGAPDDSEPTDAAPVVCDDDTTILGSASVPCPNAFLTGFGAHILVSGDSAVARVAGVELYRMGQTNVLGRYPMHFHLMGDASGRAYLTDSSIHRSFYRCVSIHGTNEALVARNVGYDAIGYCYYIEDGVEERNVLEYNLAAHVHFLGSPARTNGQFTGWVRATDALILPADVTASGTRAYAASPDSEGAASYSCR